MSLLPWTGLPARSPRSRSQSCPAPRSWLAGVANWSWCEAARGRLLPSSEQESSNILLKGDRQGIDVDEATQAILAVPGVQGVHHPHIWALSSGKSSLTDRMLSTLPALTLRCCSPLCRRC